MKYAILAGGSGTRLWPLSRKLFAKQFLPLTDEYSLLQNTVKRVSKQNGKDVYIISNTDSRFIIYNQIKEILPDFNMTQLVVEPLGRNTAPAIAYGAVHFNENDIVAVLSSDHYIENGKKFNEILKEAEKIALQDKIVTLGIVPDGPRTGYGYIKSDSSEKIGVGFKVDRFVEKPTLSKAKEYLAEGNYFWNAGIFIFKVKIFLQELQKYAPKIYEVVMTLKDKISKNIKITKEDYKKFEKISIDYALMEKTKLLFVIPTDIKWNDIGSFESLYNVLSKDSNNNALKTEKDKFFNIDTTNSLIVGGNRIIATIGIDNLVIVDTDDALLVCAKDKTERVKEIVKTLEEKKQQQIEVHTTVYRPWGSYTLLDEGQNYKVKQLFVNPGKRISLQYHKKRSETWTIVDGVGLIYKDGEELTLKPSESVFISREMKHRLTNPSSDKILKVIEVQTGEYFGEDDIIRLEDDYSRLDD